MSEAGDSDFLGRVLRLLRENGIPHMLTGSLASTAYSGPRATQDIDLVIDPTPAQLEALVAAMDPAAYYVSREAAREALAQRSMFNVIDLESGWKVDLIIHNHGRFETERFRRRVEGEAMGVLVPMVTAEDSILSKLEWRKESGSERQFRDVVNVAAAQWARIDLAYLRRWATELGVAEDLGRALAEADRIRPR